MSASAVIFVFAFLLVCLVSSLVMNMVRLQDWKVISKETVRLFLTISLGIGIFSVLVWVLEWIFIRPLV